MTVVLSFFEMAKEPCLADMCFRDTLPSTTCLTAQCAEVNSRDDVFELFLCDVGNVLQPPFLWYVLNHRCICVDQEVLVSSVVWEDRVGPLVPGSAANDFL